VLFRSRGRTSAARFHRQLGAILWDRCGISRSAPGLASAASDLEALHEEFQKDLRIVGSADSLNPSLERALRVEDFFELARLMVRDAAERNESCGAHFREEHQTPEGEAQRNDEDFMHVSAWEFAPSGPPVHHREALSFELEQPGTRSYV